MDSLINEVREAAIYQIRARSGRRAWHPDSTSGITTKTRIDCKLLREEVKPYLQRAGFSSDITSDQGIIRGKRR